MLKLTITPAEVGIGETTQIKALFVKMGEKAVSYTVTLRINGAVEDTREFFFYETYWCVACGAYCSSAKTEEATFVVTRDAPGTYSIDTNGLSGSFTVTEKPFSQPQETMLTTTPESTPTKPSGLFFILGILGALMVQGLIVFVLLKRKKTYQP